MAKMFEQCTSIQRRAVFAFVLGYAGLILVGANWVNPVFIVPLLAVWPAAGIALAWWMGRTELAAGGPPDLPADEAGGLGLTVPVSPRRPGMSATHNVALFFLFMMLPLNDVGLARPIYTFLSVWYALAGLFIWAAIPRLLARAPQTQPPQS